MLIFGTLVAAWPPSINREIPATSQSRLAQAAVASQ